MLEAEEVQVDDVQSVITREYMLIDFTGKAYRGKVKDSVQSKKVNIDAGAKRNSATVELELFAGCDAEINAINSEIGNMRQMFYDMTQPWSLDETRREGPRLIHNGRLFEFIGKYKTALVEVEAKLNALEIVWEDRCEQARDIQQGLYRSELYPSFSEVRRKWALRIDYQPVPASTDFGRLNIPAPVAEKLAERAEKRAITLVNAAIKDAYTETVKLVQRMANGTKVSDDGKKGKVYESTVDNLNLMIDNLRHFNITQDAELEAHRQSLVKMMAGIDVVELRKNDDARGHVHTEATQIADDMLASMQQYAA